MDVRIIFTVQKGPGCQPGPMLLSDRIVINNDVLLCKRCCGFDFSAEHIDLNQIVATDEAIYWGNAFIVVHVNIVEILQSIQGFQAGNQISRAINGH